MYLLPQKDNILQNIANPQWQNFSNNKLQLLFYKIIAIEDTFKKDTQSNGDPSIRKLKHRIII